MQETTVPYTHAIRLVKQVPYIHVCVYVSESTVPVATQERPHIFDTCMWLVCVVCAYARCHCTFYYRWRPSIYIYIYTQTHTHTHTHTYTLFVRVYMQEATVPLIANGDIRSMKDVDMVHTTWVVHAPCVYVHLASGQTCTHIHMTRVWLQEIFQQTQIYACLYSYINTLCSQYRSGWGHGCERPSSKPCYVRR
jgi:hypothetical protein